MFNAYSYLDWIAIRNIVNPEPTHESWGNEEEYSAEEEESGISVELVMLIAIVISMLMVLVLGGQK